MTQEELFAEIPMEKFDLLSREELIIFAKGERDLRIQLQKEVKRLAALSEELKQKSFFVKQWYKNLWFSAKMYYEFFYWVCINFMQLSLWDMCGMHPHILPKKVLINY